MASKQIAYLGPEGTYSHLVAEKLHGKQDTLIPMTTIHDVCAFVTGHSSRWGIVPIENSSGGAIYETIDVLLTENPPINVHEEITLNVRLALLGRKGEKIKKLYSHFAPLEHCAGWISKHLGQAERHTSGSTATAAQRAATERNTAALGSRKLAQYYDLDVIKYPVEEDVPNITTFLSITGSKEKITNKTKTTLAARLPNVPGSLCDFLDTFRAQNVNLSRIISRPVRGSHREYAFLVDIEGGDNLPRVKRAIDAARKTCVTLRLVGSYPSVRKYTS